ncbi:hypothetical protein GCM10011515_23370 [Tsuneonella deserti]|uniref:Uncharacterized protein n=1 Tax=Tsuneonella deserti TaxID=2035528 RepID=A0ABQ1SA81_9SPHN|nr:hypothetical protein GCM10011515_23370 [Tsuneonella deserti]
MIALCDTCALQYRRGERLDDLKAYGVLIILVNTLERLSGQCWSSAPAGAFSASAKVLRALASALQIKALKFTREEGFDCACGGNEPLAP